MTILFWAVIVIVSMIFGAIVLVVAATLIAGNISSRSAPNDVCEKCGKRDYNAVSTGPAPREKKEHGR